MRQCEVRVTRSTSMNATPQWIADFLKQENCVVWIGAGLSRVGGYPGWDALVSELCTKCGVLGFDQSQASSTEYLQKMAADCKSSSSSLYYEHLESCFGELRSKTNAAYYKLLNLGFHAYVTTNFDPLLSDAATNLGYSLFFDFPNISPRFITRNSIFHIHGRVLKNGNASARNLVLSKDEFKLAYPGAAACFVYDIFAYFPVLFVGYQIGEFEVQQLLSTANQTKLLFPHVNESGDAPNRKAVLLARSGTNDGDSTTARASNLDDFQRLNVEVAEYDPKDKDHSGLVSILDEICRVYDMKAPKIMSTPDSAEGPR